MMQNCDIVIPTYKTPEMTEKCLHSIHWHTPGFINGEVRSILIDNGDKKDRSYNTLYGLVMSSSVNLGYVKGTNMGIARSTAPFVVLQNSDTEIYYNIYERIQKVFEQDPKIGIVGTVFSPSPSWQSINNLPQWDMDKYTKCCSHAEIARQIATDYAGQWQEVGGMVAFACVMIKREVIENCGYLLERFGMGFGDDDEYCWRVQKAGYKIAVAKDCYVWHGYRTTWKNLYTDKQIEEMGLKNVRLFRKIAKGEA